jgi:C4-dicarboxylate-specific signal transduction histidine kinase
MAAANPKRATGGVRLDRQHTAERPWQGRAVSFLRAAFGVLLLGVACYAGNMASATLRFPGIGTAVLFLPYAFLTAALLLSPVRHWWLYLLTAFIGRILAYSGLEWPTTWVLLADGANMTRALVAAGGIRYFTRDVPRFDNLRGVMLFLLFAVILAPALAALLGAGVVLLHRGTDDYWLLCRAWFLSNALTGLTLLPAILIGITHVRDRRPWASAGRVLEASLLGVGLAVVGGIVFEGQRAGSGNVPALLYAPLPFLLWAVVRFGAQGATASLLLLTLQSIAGALLGRGPFLTASPTENLLSLQLFLIVASVPMLLLASLVEERARTRETLQERLGFEMLLSDLSMEVANARVADTDRAIETWLRRLAKFLSVDHALFFEADERMAVLSLMHAYPASEDPAAETVALSEEFPWYADQLRQGKTVALSRLPEELPEQASAERRYCLHKGLQSYLALPLKVGGAPRCVLAFASFRAGRPWPEELIPRLYMVGEVLANAVALKRAEERSSRLRQQLAHAGRVTMFGELAASIAHEVNQPLGAILGNAAACQLLLASEAPDLEDVRAAMEEIARDGKRAAEVIARIRGLLRKAPAEWVTLAMNDLVREVLLLARGEAVSRHAILETELAAELPPVVGDRVQLQQVILNLILNGLEAMNGVEGRARELSIGTGEAEAGRVRIWVRDTGIGLAEGDAERLFVPFYTTRPEGMGLGLAISRSIIQAHAGRLWATPNAEHGATFYVELPAGGSPLGERPVGTPPDG